MFGKELLNQKGEREYDPEQNQLSTQASWTLAAADSANVEATRIQLTSGSEVGNTAANGSAHNNMPPYLSVYMWQRTA